MMDRRTTTPSRRKQLREVSSRWWGSAERGAVLGQTDEGGCFGPDGYGYVACPVDFDFEDISTTGNPILEGWITQYETLRPNKLNGFQFNFYGTTYDTVFVSVDGLIAFGEGHMGDENTDLTTYPTQAVIAPLWDGFVNYRKGEDAILWEVRDLGDSQELIVQWDNITTWDLDTDPMTFQVVLNESDRSIQFNYLDLHSDTVGNQGASATVGIKDVVLKGRIESFFPTTPVPTPL